MSNEKDTIYRQAAIDALWKALYEYEDKTERQFIKSDELDVADWFQHRIFVQTMSDIDRQTILALPSAQPELKCDTCRYRSLEWYEEPCDSCTMGGETNHYKPSAQPEITDEQAIEHLRSTGWMQNHDREMYDMGFKEQLADDSESYDSLLPSAQPEWKTELESAETQIEILSALRAQFNCFDEAEEPVYRALSDAICALSAQPERKKGKITYTHFSEELWGQSAICISCGCKWQIAEEGEDNFCPNCGCKMER